MTTESRPADGQRSAEHLCVLVHGLWGNPNHLNYVADALREDYNEDKLVILVAKRNAGSFTYDGIEVGAERVAKEIEEKLEDLAEDGYRINKLSVVGYSLGGLVARYAVGLLYHKGYFEKIKPMTFTTFATPHLGVRTPSKGYSDHLWNVLGARTLSISGRQLFDIDDFRETGRSILDVMTDPNSVFIHALRQFQRRTLYCNIVNDRSAVYYTTAISRTDPYVDLDKLSLKHVPGYDPVILDPDTPFTLKREHQDPTFYSRLTTNSSSLIRRLPIYIPLTLIIPIASIVFLINSGFQTFRSNRRIMLHHSAPSNQFGSYRIDYFVQNMQASLENVLESVNSAQQQEYLDDGTAEPAEPTTTSATLKANGHAKSAQPLLSEKNEPSPAMVRTRTTSHASDFPTLALTPAQFGMIKSLDEVGWRKYPCHITKSRHSHAAIIVRIPSRKGFEEGKVVVRHWVKEEFLL